MVDNELVPGLAIRGGDPEDTVLLFEGFELPLAFHDDGVRSIVPPGAAYIELEPGGFGVEHGRGSSIVSIDPAGARAKASLEATTVDATVTLRQPGSTSSPYGRRSTLVVARVGSNRAVREVRDEDALVFQDLLLRTEYRLATPWWLAASVIASSHGNGGAGRAVLATRYQSTGWRATLAVSTLVQNGDDLDRNTADSRIEIIRTAPRAAGLTKLAWRLGQQTNSSRYQLADRSFWRHDIAGWSSVAANLSPTIRATAGLRIDDFDGDVATQPRARVAATVVPHLELSIAAGAYRRPPEQTAELVQGDLNPERATEVIAGATYDDRRTLRVQAAAYSIDRRRLVAADAAGVLHNTGFGSSVGLELAAAVVRGPWFGLVSATLARSRRFDFERAAEHPAAYEQPFKLEVLGVWRHARWTFAARFSLASGLPYTPYTDSVYDADRDTWEPLYVPPLSARTPLHHQLDVRADYAFRLGRVGLAAFFDLHNAYRNRDAIGYSFSYDYRERTAISALPIFPFAGLRASL